MNTKGKGSLAVANVIAKAISLGYKVFVPFDEDTRADVVIDREGVLERVQVKYTESDGKVIAVKCRSTNNWTNKKYTRTDVDWIAVYDLTTNRCYFISSSLLGDDGRAEIYLRLTAPKNGQEKNVRWAKDFEVW